jgi:hypothetical protein
MACSNTHPKCAIIPNFLLSVSARWWLIGARNTADYHHDHSISTSRSYLALTPLTPLDDAIAIKASTTTVVPELRQANGASRSAHPRGGISSTPSFDKSVVDLKERHRSWDIC